MLRSVAERDWSESEVQEVQHLINHNEHSVALTALAWIVVERGRTLTRDQYAELIELVNDFPDSTDLPPNLQSHVYG